MLKVRWLNLERRLVNHDGRPIRRPFSLALLPPSLERALADESGQALVTGLAAMAGLPGGAQAVWGLTFELFQEGALQLVFCVHVQPWGKGRPPIRVGMLLAKEGGGVSHKAWQEAELLRTLGRQTPGTCVQLGAGGYLPRLTQSGQTVPLYWYVSRWLPEHRELASDPGHHFFVNDITLEHHRERLDGEALRAAVVRTMAWTWDPQRKTGLATPEINSGDFVIRVPPRPPYELLLIAARGLVTGEEPGRLVARLAAPAGRYGDRPFRLCPSEPHRFRRALEQGFIARAGVEQGQRLLLQAWDGYLALLRRGSVELPPWFTLHRLQETAAE